MSATNPDKRFATLRARLALLGYVVHQCSSGGYLVARWDMSRFCSDLDALAGFLHQVEKAC